MVDKNLLDANGNLKKEKFFELYNLSYVGDPREEYTHVNNALLRELKTFKGELVTFDFLKERYENYLSWWDKRYGKREERFIPKSERKIGIGTFCFHEMYEQEYKEINEREEYLFGNNTQKHLTEQLDKFRRLCKCN